MKKNKKNKKYQTPRLKHINIKTIDSQFLKCGQIDGEYCAATIKGCIQP